MGVRARASVAVAWTVAYAAVYLIIVGRQDSSPARWYLGLLVIAVGLLVPALAGRGQRVATVVGAALLIVAALLGLLSVGLLLLPAAGFAVLAAAGSR